MSVGALLVAKKRTAPSPPDKGDDDEGPRQIVLAMKGRRRWKQWLSDFAKSERVDEASLIDIALTAHAKQRGFQPPPER